jgi:hypothetical protein
MYTAIPLHSGGLVDCSDDRVRPLDPQSAEGCSGCVSESRHVQRCSAFRVSANRSAAMVSSHLSSPHCTGFAIGNRKLHGGDDQAVYAYAREDIDVWETQLSRSSRRDDRRRIPGPNIRTGPACAVVGGRCTLGGTQGLCVLPRCVEGKLRAHRDSTWLDDSFPSRGPPYLIVAATYDRCEPTGRATGRTRRMR